MDVLIFVVIVTLAIRSAVEKGRGEYTDSQARYTKELRKSHPNWTKEKVARRARRMARGYWWDQARRGFPDTRAAYAEARELAEAERLEAERDGLKRRKDTRERMAKAIEEAEKLRKQEWEAYRAGDQRSPNPPYWGDGRRRNKGSQPAPDNPAAQPPETAPATAPDTNPNPNPASTPAGDEADGSERLVKCPSCGSAVPKRDVNWNWDREKKTYRYGCPGCLTEPQHQRPENAEADARGAGPAGTAPFTVVGGPDAPESPDDDPGGGPGAGAKPAGGDNVVPMDRTGTARNAQPAPTTGGPAVTTTMTGEVTSYEQIHASYKADVERLEEAAAAYERRSAAQQSALEDLRVADAAYERRISGLRSLRADDQTIGDVAQLRETNEQHIAGAEEALEKTATAAEANRRQLAAAQEALDNWVTRQGAVRDIRQATGVRGDDPLYA